MLETAEKKVMGVIVGNEGKGYRRIIQSIRIRYEGPGTEPSRLLLLPPLVTFTVRLCEFHFFLDS